MHKGRFINYIKKMFSIFILLVVIASVSGFIFVLKIVLASDDPTLKMIIEKEVTTILDNNDDNIVLLEKKNENKVTFNELPDTFINALISIEDSRFFEHFGIDLTRILASITNNIINPEKIQGASTLTQQLIKNVFLDSNKTIERKISEAYMAIKMETTLSKEQIFEEYANRIMFDGVNVGVNTASLKFFNKNISQVNLPEAALLAGMVNAPSYYNPIRNPENAEKRKNLVLQLMYENKYISLTQLEKAKVVSVSDMINKMTYQEEIYPYQSYLDVVYQEVKYLTGLDPFTTPMLIKTYMDKDVQKLIDNIQNNLDSKVTFTDKNQQVGIALVDNESGALIGIGGGRNYQGQLLFNRASDMQNQPASTVKPLLSYALAIEYLNWTNNHVVDDLPYTYKGTTKSVNNVDAKYMGELFLSEALGYSRNTSALITLDKVIEEIGVDKVINYLEAINLLDVDRQQFNMSYGLGAMYYGTSPIDLAGAYSMLARKGVYIKPYTIKSIELLDGTNRIIIPQKEEIKVLSEETSFMISEVLKDIVDNNYWGIGSIDDSGLQIRAKTGTSSFDESIINKYNYPANASKDIWYAGYSADYTSVVWSGFDKPVQGEKNYFLASYDERKYIPRKIFSRLISFKAVKGKTLPIPENLVKVNIVKGTYPYLLPDRYTPSNMIISSYFRKDDIPNTYISPPAIENLNDIELTIIDDQLNVNFPSSLINIVDVEQGRKIFSFDYIYGKKTYVIEIDNLFNESKIYTSESPNFVIPLLDADYYKIRAYTNYSRVSELRSNIIEKDFLYTGFNL